MCGVSAVSEYYMHTWPQRFPSNPNPFAQGVFGQQVDHQLRADMAKVLQLLDSIDKRLKDVECLDEQKKAFLAQFEGIDLGNS